MQPNRWRNEPWRGCVRLAAALVALAVLWLVLLPLVGRQNAVHSYIEHNEALDIDPAAKFYTELPAMQSVLDRLEAARHRDAAAFW